MLRLLLDYFEDLVFKALGFFLIQQQKRICEYGLTAFYTGDHIRTTCPMRFGKISRRPFGWVIRMRVIKADDIIACKNRFPLNANQFSWADVIAIGG